jgi:pimeloyl-ACP methyl ester carboxylesterase
MEDIRWLESFDRHYLGRSSPTAQRRGWGPHPVQGNYWTRPGERPRVALIATHYNHDFAEHYAAPYFAERGFGFLGCNSRFRGAEDQFQIEHALIDIGVGVRWLKEEAGVEKVVLFGNSGGGPLMAAYQVEAATGALAARAENEAVRHALAHLLPGDLYMSVNAHVGRAQVITDWMDAAVVDENDPTQTDPALDIFNPANGPPFSAEFLDRYRAAQRARNQRITDWAKAELRRLNAAGIPDRIFPLFRFWGDPRFVDATIDPSDRRTPHCYAGDPAVANLNPINIARANTLRSWLSMWSLETAKGQGEKQLAAVTVPSLVVQGLGDAGVFPSDARRVYGSLGAEDKRLALIPGAHYFEDSLDVRLTAIDLMTRWIEARLRPRLGMRIMAQDIVRSRREFRDVAFG